MRALRTVPTGAGGPLVLCGPMRAEMDAPDPGTAPSGGGGRAGALSRVLGDTQKKVVGNGDAQQRDAEGTVFLSGD